MLSDYYEFRGWDEFGIPLPDKLESLGIKKKHQAWELSLVSEPSLGGESWGNEVFKKDSLVKKPY